MVVFAVAGIAVLLLLSGWLSPCHALTSTWDTTTGDWHDGTKWDNGVPGNGVDAVISAGADILLTNATTILGSLTMDGGTLTFTNWNTRLIATNVVINAGTITLPERFTSSQMSNRVWIVCSNAFTLNTNAVIDVNEKGWAGGNGPGAGLNTAGRAGGGGYGGKGGRADWWSYKAGPAYGSTNAPLDPGSGGGDTPYGGAHGSVGGGGAVRIHAEGTVTIHGTVDARGGTHPTHSYNGAGSGGAIYITCAVFQGSTNGLLNVDGGSLPYYSAAGGGAGGGGRIAVGYTTLGAPHGVRFSAAPGGSSWIGPLYEDEWWLAADPGTLWLPDTALLATTMGDGLFTGVRLYINGVSSWSADSLTVDNCSFTFAHAGFQLTVTNECRIDSGGALGIGTLASGSNPVMTCGSLILTNGGTLTIYSGKTNGIVQDYGALVSVTGDVVIGAGSWIIPFSHVTDGGSVLFRMTNLTVAAGGGFNAHARGYAMTNGPGQPPQIQFWSYSGGGGYGGKGGEGTWWSNYGGPANGLTNAPGGPGSGGGYCPYASGYGGGCVRIEATANAILNGTIDANGSSPNHFYAGAGSGGGIYLKCATFGGTADGMLKANGGTAGSPPNLAGGAGGGGRIAVHYQSLASPCATLFSTSPGGGWTDGDVDNRWWMGPQMGTLYLSGTNLLTPTLTDGRFHDVRLVVTGFTAWAVNDLTVSNTSLTLENPSLLLTVSGDLRIGNGTLGVHELNCAGNVILTNGGRLAVTDMACGGNLTLSDSAALSVYSGMTNGSPNNYGALVDISGDLSTDLDSWIYPYSHDTDGGSPLFRVRDLLIATNSGFNANDRGFGVGKGYGVGTTWGEQGGGSGYGGKGGRGVSVNQPGGATYGSTNAPLAPGSGTDCPYGDAHGGGLVRVEATDVVTMNGTITARGGKPKHTYSSGGSGGGIFIICDAFSGALGSLLDAEGGTPGAAGYYGGGGGGGRIAVWYAVPTDKQATILAGENAGQTVSNDYSGFLGTTTVTNGLGWTNLPPDGAASGTIVFLTVPPPVGTLILVR